MARIVITRPNGETEYAELTTDKALAGNDRLAVEKDGTAYYAKLDSGVSTHMYVIKPDGRKLYVQKELKFVWNYAIGGIWDNAKDMVLPRTGKYRLTYDRWDTQGTTEEKRQETKKDIFEQGTKFIKGEWADFSIKAKNGHTYQASYSWDNGGEPEIDPDYEAYYLQIDTIEYIGEA